MTLSLVVVAKDQWDLTKFDLGNVLGQVDELIMLANPGARFGGLGVIGNHVLDHGRGDVVGLVHADAVLSAGAIGAFCREATAGSVCGMVGRALGGEYVWCNDIQEPRAVSTLDSCAIFARRDIGVRFDTETFDGFHCCVEDFCLQAWAHGAPTKIAPASGCQHLGTMWGQREWMGDYSKYRALLSKKWAGVGFSTT